MNSRRPKLLFFVSVDWFFCSHFLSRAVAARNAGFDVLVLTHVAEHRHVIEAAGLRLIPLEIDRRTLNPVAGLITLFRILRVFRTERPEILHHVALKPILLGSLAAHFCRSSKVLNAVVGGGYLFTSKKIAIRYLRPLFKAALRLLVNANGAKVVFENPDDLNTFVIEGYVRRQDAVLIRGAGVDPRHYRHVSSVTAVPIVLLAARLLWDKGIGEFVEAARILRKEGVKARFVVVGGVDPGNRASIDKDTLGVWRNEGVVELWGFRTDMPEVLAQASIACLPSYREGLPKVLLEAMATGLPCVTTDVPGCREAVRHGDNGLLVPARDPRALAQALDKLIQDSSMRERMGARGRERVEKEFSSDLVIRETLALYQKMLAS